MTRLPRTRWLAAGAASMLISLAVLAHEPTSAAASGSPSAKLQRIMTPSMPMPSATGNVDHDFAALMTMHHQQAIDMADVMIASGHDAKLKAMARKMKSAQQAEIAQLAPYAK